MGERGEGVQRDLAINKESALGQSGLGGGRWK